MNRLFYNIYQTFKNFDVGRDKLVLEIGCGANPSPRSDVLLDKYPVISRQHRTSLSTARIDDRPFIVGDVHALPFPNNSFDFIIAKHVLEHSHDPAQFVREVRRVAPAGFISTPSPFTELVHGGYQNVDGKITKEHSSVLHHGIGTEGHKWFVLIDDKRIYLHAKSKDIYPIYLFLGSFVKNNTDYEKKDFFKRYPRWLESQVKYASRDLELIMVGEINENKEEGVDIEDLIASIESLTRKLSRKCNGKRLLRRYIFGTKKQYNIFDKFVCPVCRGSLKVVVCGLVCSACGEFPIVNGVPILIKEGLNRGNGSGLCKGKSVMSS